MKVTVNLNPVDLFNAVKAGTMDPTIAAAFLTPAERKPRKVSCPITPEHFTANAHDLEVAIGDMEVLIAKPLTFSSGSLGWTMQIKTSIPIGGIDTPVTGNLNIFVTGSKPAAPNA
jgi:hypothetical protein